MQITLNLPDSLTQTDTFNQSDWLREITIPVGTAKLNALFQQERFSLSRASKIAGLDPRDFQKMIADRGICVHYDVEDFEQDIQHRRDRGWP
jgi:predicted HTH domain antitoxin